MKRKLLFILIPFTLISKKSFSFYGNEISLFDKNGNAKAYIDNNTIFDWNGTPFAYIYIDNNNYPRSAEASALVRLRLLPQSNLSK